MADRCPDTALTCPRCQAREITICVDGVIWLYWCCYVEHVRAIAAMWPSQTSSAADA